MPKSKAKSGAICEVCVEKGVPVQIATFSPRYISQHKRQAHNIYGGLSGKPRPGLMKKPPSDKILCPFGCGMMIGRTNKSGHKKTHHPELPMKARGRRASAVSDSDRMLPVLASAAQGAGERRSAHKQEQDLAFDSIKAVLLARDSHGNEYIIEKVVR